MFNGVGGTLFVLEGVTPDIVSPTRIFRLLTRAGHGWLRNDHC